MYITGHIVNRRKRGETVRFWTKLGFWRKWQSQHGQSRVKYDHMIESPRGDMQEISTKRDKTRGKWPKKEKKKNTFFRQVVGFRPSATISDDLMWLPILWIFEIHYDVIHVLLFGDCVSLFVHIGDLDSVSLVFELFSDFWCGYVNYELVFKQVLLVSAALGSAAEGGGDFFLLNHGFLVFIRVFLWFKLFCRV